MALANEFVKSPTPVHFPPYSSYPENYIIVTHLGPTNMRFGTVFGPLLSFAAFSFVAATSTRLGHFRITNTD